MNPDNYAAKTGFATLSAKDYAELRTSARRVYDYMKDGEWKNAQDIIDASETREGLRRMRELREHYTVESVRCSKDNRNWKYRLVAKEETQAELL